MSENGGDVSAWFSVPLDAVEVIENGRPLFGGWFGDESPDDAEL